MAERAQIAQRQRQGVRARSLQPDIAAQQLIVEPPTARRGVEGKAQTGAAGGLRQGAGQVVAAQVLALAVQQGQSGLRVKEHRKGPRPALIGLMVQQDRRAIKRQGEFDDEQAAFQQSGVGRPGRRVFAV